MKKYLPLCLLFLLGLPLLGQGGDYLKVRFLDTPKKGKSLKIPVSLLNSPPKRNYFTTYLETNVGEKGEEGEKEKRIKLDFMGENIKDLILIYLTVPRESFLRILHLRSVKQENPLTEEDFLVLKVLWNFLFVDELQEYSVYFELRQRQLINLPEDNSRCPFCPRTPSDMSDHFWDHPECYVKIGDWKFISLDYHE